MWLKIRRSDTILRVVSNSAERRKNSTDKWEIGAFQGAGKPQPSDGVVYSGVSDTTTSKGRRNIRLVFKMLEHHFKGFSLKILHARTHAHAPPTKTVEDFGPCETASTTRQGVTTYHEHSSAICFKNRGKRPPPKGLSDTNLDSWTSYILDI